ncbi:MAG: ATP-binding protein [Bacteroidia bacterium]|nr:ATP-binding protein [Bacteroidia bacterium]
MIPRILSEKIRKLMFKGKAIILTGARRTGKTTLLTELVKSVPGVRWMNGDEPDVQGLFEQATSTRLRAELGSAKVIVIDEAQRIRDIGLKMKLITDQIPEVQLIASGSSSFELANKVNEPLTGRKWEFLLFPFSFSEMKQYHGGMEEKRMLKHRLIYGYYPEVVNANGNERDILKLLTDSYLHKDILMWEQIRRPEKLVKLLQALAFQLGNEVSYHELGHITDLDKVTVEKYIHLLEQTFIIFRLGSLSRNLRKELKASRKVYFYDNGIRNAIISNFNTPELRQDIGSLWENFLMSERAKHLHYNSIWANRFFWRTHDQQEIDYVEERDGKFFAYEFKWNPKSKYRFSKSFTNAYPDNETKIVSQNNFEEFVDL